VSGKPFVSNSAGSIIPSCLANFLSLSSMIGNGNSPEHVAWLASYAWRSLKIK
jgi:hypothetical protein